MRLQRPRQGLRCRRDEHDDGALEIHALEVVDLSLRDVEAVAHEHHRCINSRRRIDAKADVGVLTKHQRLGLAVADQRQARLRFDNLARVEFDRLHVAANTGWLQPSLLELRRNVFGRKFVSRAAGVAALHAVVGERLDMGKPAR